MKMLYLNNCDGKDHAELYGTDAFFDLYIDDSQPKKLVPGQECLVATRTKDGQVTFYWFSFSRRSKNVFEGPNGKVRDCKVFHGYLTKKLGPYSQAKAASVVPAFFTKNGEFKQWKFHEG
jgi:hypothetical protein